MTNWVKIGSIVGLSLSLLTGGGLFLNAELRTSPPSNTKQMVTFTINGSSADINQDTGEMDLTLPSGTNLSNLIPVYTTTGSMVTVNAKAQISGHSAQNFESDVNYVVYAYNNTHRVYYTHITTTPSESYYDIQYFGVNANQSINYGTVNGTDINIMVPSNVNLANMTPYFSFIGNHISVESVDQYSNYSTQNFTSPVTYQLFANDGTPVNYTVSVTKYAPSAESITSYSIITSDGVFEGTINEAESTIHVGVPEDVITSHLIANFETSGSSVKVSGSSQTNGLTVNNFTDPIVYSVISGDGSESRNYTVTVDHNYTFLDIHDISNTLYDNTTYRVSFHVTNRETAPITGVHVVSSIPAPFVVTPISNGCNNVTLDVGHTCVVTEDLEIPASQDSAIVDVKVLDESDVVHAHYNKIVTAIKSLHELEPSIPHPESYGVYTLNANTLNNHRGIHSIYAAATVNGKSICFDANYVGTIQPIESQSFESCAVLLRPSHPSLYIPAQLAGGAILYSIDNKLSNGPYPSVTSLVPLNNYNTPWQQVEYAGGVGALYNLNPTAVNFNSVPMGISTVISGVVGVYADGSDAYQGLLYGNNINGQPIYHAIQDGLSAVPNSPANAWAGLTYYNTLESTNLMRVISPTQDTPESTSPFYFNGVIYSQYIDDIWDYYTDNIGGHYLYSNDDPIANIESPGNTCTVRCQVTHVDNLMHCESYIGECGQNSTTGTVDGAYNVGSLPGESAESGFTKFTAQDFISSAGSYADTTFGWNQTYRSVTGQNIVSAQSVGFMPFCSNLSYVFGPDSLRAEKHLYYIPQYTCLPNYNDYTTSVINQYSALNTLYFAFYNYGYSDTLGQSGAEYSANIESYPFTISINY